MHTSAGVAALASAALLSACGAAAHLSRYHHVEIVGAEHVDRDLIASDIVLRGPGEEDVDLTFVKQLYAAAGYPEAKLEVRRVGTAEPPRLRVHITEGRFARVDRVTLEVDALPEAGAWVPTLPLKVGGGFSATAYEDTYKAVVAALHGAGYPTADVTHGAFVDPQTLEVRVSFLVAAGDRGERYRFGPIFVAGARTVPGERIRREAEPLARHGDPFDVTKLDAIRERVVRLGAFWSVRVVPGAIDASRRVIPIVIAVRER